MTRFLYRWLLLTLATAATVFFLPGIHAYGDNLWLAYGSFALFMALINSSIKPFMQLLALPLSILSFGLVAIIINVICFEFASQLANAFFGTGIVSDSFMWSLIGAGVLALFSSWFSAIVKD